MLLDQNLGMQSYFHHAEDIYVIFPVKYILEYMPLMNNVIQ